jgi:multicomponent Na+:H+ antiporter subunit G
MRFALDIFTIVAVSAGSLLFMAGTAGLIRFPDTLTRLHALSKVDNLALGFIVIGLLPQIDGPLDALKLVTVWILGQFSGAIVSQLIARAARRAEHQQ